MRNIGRAQAIISGTRIYIRDRTPEDDVLEGSFADDIELLELDPAGGRCDDPAFYSVITVDGVHIGNMSAYNYEVTHAGSEVEMGIRIWDRAYWNRGYGSEAINVFCDWAFDTVGVERITVKTPVSNTRAQKCYRKCGFVGYKYANVEGIHMVCMERMKT